jgi:hypothetical protein
MPLRTLLLTKKNTYSYDKAFFGSYKDFVPNHYIYGYQMVNYGLEKYGPHLWKDALIYSGRNPYLVTPLALYLIKNTGRAKQSFYKSAMDSLRNIYLSVDDQSSYISYKPVTDTAKNDYINYYQPEFTSEGAIISFKTGLDQNDQIISIDSHGNEKVLHLPGQSDMESLRRRQLYLCGMKLHGISDWGGRNYSESWFFDITKRRLFH